MMDENTEKVAVLETYNTPIFYQVDDSGERTQINIKMDEKENVDKEQWNKAARIKLKQIYKQTDLSGDYPVFDVKIIEKTMKPKVKEEVFVGLHENILDLNTEW